MGLDVMNKQLHVLVHESILGVSAFLVKLGVIIREKAEDYSSKHLSILEDIDWDALDDTIHFLEKNGGYYGEE
jgi:hypothetical protein